MSDGRRVGQMEFDLVRSELKNLFSKDKPEPATTEQNENSKPTIKPAASDTPSVLTKPCKTCGKPIKYNPAWKHVPNYCPDCKAKYRAEQEAKRGMVTITCKNCGKS